MLQRAWKHCVSHFKLYTSKIPWSDHQLTELTDILVVSYCGRMLRCVSPEAFTLPGQTCPALHSKWGTLVYTQSCDGVAKAFTVSYDVHSRRSPAAQQQSTHSKAAEVPLQGFTWLAPLLFGVSHEHIRLVALPRALLQWRTKLQFRHTTENRTPEKMILPLTISSSLKPTCQVYVNVYIYMHTHSCCKKKRQQCH